MKCQILHESRGRMRVRMNQYRMTPGQADQLQYYLQAVKGVAKASVHERTMDAVVQFLPEAREDVARALAEFDYETSEAAVPEHTGRELTRQYEDKFFFLLVRRIITRFLLPMPLRTVVTAVKSLKYIAKGLESLARKKLEVSVLDATTITVSLFRGDIATAGTVMFLLDTGGILEEWTHKKSVDDLAQRMYLNVDKVWIRTEEAEVLIPIDQVEVGDVVIARTGNLIPLDGIVTGGEASVNQASMTGESMPVRKGEGSAVYAGTVLEEGELAIRVGKALGSGRYDRIIRMIEESEKLKSGVESKAAHIADELVPWSLGGTALTYLLTRNVNKALAILMVDFSCALKLAMPISVLSAMKECGDHRISVKGGKFLENMAEAQTIVFDKTGTLTHAAPTVREVVSFCGNEEREMLRLAACLEEHFPHSIANAVVEEAKRRDLKHEEEHTRVEYVVAHGIASSIGGKRVLIGSRHFIFEDEGCSIPPGEEDKFDSLPRTCSHLYLAIDQVLAAVILIEDPVREEAADVIRALHEQGFTKLVMMTGDSRTTAEAVAEMLGVDAFYAEVLPEDKAAFIRSEKESGRKVIMVGDGVNDSPALSEADVGIAISAGAAIAREIADITISVDDLYELVTLRTLSEALMSRIRGNYRRIMLFNGSLIALGVFGILPPATTALLHNVSTLFFSADSMTPLL
ncbi:MAG: heavy metal translocating P-type ATPase [Lachnospiraceae bacterium]|nr:heavy metal translocating P-type ATPase [Lachnospiraceae bacterium]